MLDLLRDRAKDNVSDRLFSIADTIRDMGVDQINAAVSQATHGDVLDARFNLRVGHVIKNISN